MNAILFYNEIKIRTPSVDALIKADVPRAVAEDLLAAGDLKFRSGDQLSDSENVLDSMWICFDFKDFSVGGISFEDKPKSEGRIIRFGNASDYVLALSDGQVVALNQESDEVCFTCAESFSSFLSGVIKVFEFYVQPIKSSDPWWGLDNRINFAKECSAVAKGDLDFYFLIFGVPGGEWS